MEPQLVVVLAIRLVWIALSTTTLAVSTFLVYASSSTSFNGQITHLLRDVSSWGKAKQYEKLDGSEERVSSAIRSTHFSGVALKSLTALLNIRKDFFLHFYVFGSISSVVCLLLVSSPLAVSWSTWVKQCPMVHEDTISSSYWKGSLSRLQCIFGLVLMLLQTGRRLYESFTFAIPVAPGSKPSTMHVAHYMVGLVFYALCCSSLVFEWNIDDTSFYTDTYDTVLMLLGSFIFLWASKHQHRCHEILFELRLEGELEGISATNGAEKSRYKVPHGDWFRYVSSPHYCAEIIIYVSILIATGLTNFTWLLSITFVASNLAWGAYQTQKWYKGAFLEYPADRKILLPGVW
eukprot:CFRG5463T1